MRLNPSLTLMLLSLSSSTGKTKMSNDVPPDQDEILYLLCCMHFNFRVPYPPSKDPSHCRTSTPTMDGFWLMLVVFSAISFRHNE